MAINGSGIRDTSRVLSISKTTVIRWIKKKSKRLTQVNPNVQVFEEGQPRDVTLKPFCEEAELDEQGSFVRRKSNQRWIWLAVEHSTNTVLASVFGRRKEVVFKALKALLKPLNIQKY
jgi:hypothetical protein